MEIFLSPQVAAIAIMVFGAWLGAVMFVLALCIGAARDIRRAGKDRE
jgi:hypothetical protein